MEEKIKTLRIIHLAMSVGTAIFCIVIGSFSDEILKFPEVNSSSIIWLSIPIIAFFLSNFLFKKNLKQAEEQKDFDGKLMAYQNASITRWAVLEAGAIIIPLLKPQFLVLSILIIIYLIFLHPTENRIKMDLQIFG